MKGLRERERERTAEWQTWNFAGDKCFYAHATCKHRSHSSKQNLLGWYEGNPLPYFYPMLIIAFGIKGLTFVDVSFTHLINQFSSVGPCIFSGIGHKTGQY